MILSDLPKKFYPKRSSSVMLLLGSAAFVATGIWMGTSGKPIGYFCAAFFGLGVIVALVKLIPDSAYLKLSLKFLRLIKDAELEELALLFPVSEGMQSGAEGYFNEEEPGTHLFQRVKDENMFCFWWD